jgi:biopolymer transport protein ExbD
MKRSFIKFNDDDLAKPQLTSLVDVLTVLLIFLIRTFSADGSPVNPVSSIALPVSVNKEAAKLMTSIEITPQNLQINGKPVTTVAKITESDSLFIPELYEYLMKNQAIAKKEDVMIQSDKSVEFTIIKKVMYTSSKAGAVNFTILAVNEE